MDEFVVRCVLLVIIGAIATLFLMFVVWCLK